MTSNIKDQYENAGNRAMKYIASLVGLLISTATFASGTVWESTGVADCTGQDIVFTQGATPDATYAASGRTAICWDGKEYSNRNSPGVAFCTYKKVDRQQCVGGGNPGSAYSPVAVNDGWIKKGVGDCPGMDINTTYGSSIPDVKLITPKTTAVCWDGKQYSNLNMPGVAFCTYKSVTQQQCSGGRNPGVMYEPGLVFKVRWEKVATGDCTGRDYTQTDGDTPVASYATPNTTAVCWDGKAYSNKNAPGKAFCTYKNVTSTQCSGGSNVGIMYKSVE